MFPWIFNPPATYWDGASEILKYLGGGSLDDLKGKTIGYLYFDAGFGKEPMPLFQDAVQGTRLHAEALSRRPRRHAEPGRRNGSTSAATSPISW